MKMLALLFVAVFSGPAFLAAQSDSALNSIVVPSIQFAETPISDAVEFLVQRSRELDAAEKDPKEKGINVVLVGDFSDTKLTLRLSDVPLGVVLSLVAELADAKMEVSSEAVVIFRGKLYESVKRKPGSEPLEAKLQQLKIPSIEFQETPLRDALDFLQQRSVELDKGAGEGTAGVNVVLKGDHPGSVTLRLQEVSLYTALEMTVRAAGYEMELREHLVWVNLAKVN